MNAVWERYFNAPKTFGLKLVKFLHLLGKLKIDYVILL